VSKFIYTTLREESKGKTEEQYNDAMGFDTPLALLYDSCSKRFAERILSANRKER